MIVRETIQSRWSLVTCNLEAGDQLEMRFAIAETEIEDIAWIMWPLEEQWNTNCGHCATSEWGNWPTSSFLYPSKNCNTYTIIPIHLHSLISSYSSLLLISLLLIIKLQKAEIPYPHSWNHQCSYVEMDDLASWTLNREQPWPNLLSSLELARSWRCLTFLQRKQNLKS